MSKYKAIIVNFLNGANGQVEKRACIPTQERSAGTFLLGLEMAFKPRLYNGLCFAENGKEGGQPGRLNVDLSKIRVNADGEQEGAEGFVRGLWPEHEDVEWLTEPLSYAEVELAEFQWNSKGLDSAGISCAIIRRYVSLLTHEGTPTVPWMQLSEWSSDEGLAAWTLALLRSLSELPHEGHNAAAKRAIERFMPDSAPELKIRAAGLLAQSLCKTLREWNAGGLSIEGAREVHEGLYRLDASFCDLLESLGELGAEMAGELRSEQREAWSLWLKKDWEADIWHTDFLRILAGALWADLVQAQFEQERELEAVLEAAAPLNERLRVVQENGALYSQMPKAGGATAWAWGGPGNNEPLDGFSVVPDLVRFIPHGHSLMPDGNRPAQTQIPIGLELALPGRGSRLVLTPTEGQLLLVMFASIASSGGARANLGELTRALNKGKARIRARDHEAIAQALHTLRQLRLALPDKTDITLFSVRAPVLDGGPYEDREVSWCATEHLKQLLVGKLRGAEALRSLNGAFVFNLSKALAFNGKEAAHLRAYMYAAALWNDAQCNPDKILMHTLEQWAAATNMLSPGAVKCLEGDKASAGRAALSRDKNEAWKVLQDLEARGDLIIEGTKRRFRPLPTDDHKAAFEKHRGKRADTLAFLGRTL